MTYPDTIIVAFIILAGIILSIVLKKLTVIAALTGGIIALLLLLATGYGGVVLMATFFIVGTAATSWQIEYKRKLQLAEENKGRRTTMQVLANAGVAGILSLFILLKLADTQLFYTMIAASFAAATSDTLSSEMGNIYGRSFYNIVTFKKDEKGLDGVVSFEGLMFGVLGSTIIALIAQPFLDSNWKETLIIAIAGVAGNLFDSILGAIAERKNIIGNNTVNFLNTLIAALIAALLMSI